MHGSRARVRPHVSPAGDSVVRLQFLFLICEIHGKMTIPPQSTTKPIVLFLCTGNSARSQMAEAYLRQHGGEHFEACSAGLNPRGIHPLTAKVMHEAGISLDGHRSKSLDEFLGKVSASHVIFVCDRAEQSCPRIWPFTLRPQCMPFPDPAAAEGTEEQRLEVFRSVRDEIEASILARLKQNTPSSAVAPHNQ